MDDGAAIEALHVTVIDEWPKCEMRNVRVISAVSSSLVVKRQKVL
jgi:hypothetical protein